MLLRRYRYIIIVQRLIFGATQTDWW